MEGSGREIAQCYLTLLDSIELNSVMRECSSTIHSTAALITVSYNYTMIRPGIGSIPV